MSNDASDDRLGDLLDAFVARELARGATPSQAVARLQEILEKVLRNHPAAAVAVAAAFAAVSERHGLGLD